MRAYSQDLRDRVLRALERGERPTEIARRFEVSRVWVYQVRDRWQQDGRRSSLRVGGYRRSCLAEMESELRGWIEAEADLTLAEICERVAQLQLPGGREHKRGFRSREDAEVTGNHPERVGDVHVVGIPKKLRRGSHGDTAPDPIRQGLLN